MLTHNCYPAQTKKKVYYPAPARTAHQPSPAIARRAALFRKEKGIPARVPSNVLGVVLVGLEVLPHVGRVDVLVALIPPPIHHLGDRRVVRRPFEFRETRRAAQASCAGTGSRRPRREGFGAVVEEELVVRARGLVDDEEVELVMLDRNISIKTGIQESASNDSRVV